MHIPDGFVDGKTAIAAATLSATGLGLALRRVRRELPARRMPLLGLAAAFLFAAQMVNFPVAGGTSGHLMGGVLVAVLLGPSAAVVVLATVLLVQCLLFGDGGVSALGSNLLDMGILGAGGGFLVFRAVAARLRGLRGKVAALAFSSWCSVVFAAMGCAGQLAWSDTVAFTTGFPVMTTVHMLVGLGEGAISALVFLAIHRVRPDLTSGDEPATRSGGLGLGLLAALGIAVFVAPFASPLPDALEATAHKLGFASKVIPPVVPAAARDYLFPGIHSSTVATAIAALLGSLVVFVLALLLGKLLVAEPRNPSAQEPPC
jgi:cobalt/nickel transport system permease protein